MTYEELKEQVRHYWKLYYYYVCDKRYMVREFNRTLDDLSNLKFEGYKIIEDYDTRHEFAHIISEMMTLGKLFGKYKFYHRVMKFVKYYYLSYKFNKLP